MIQALQRKDLLGEMSRALFGFSSQEVCTLTDSHTKTRQNARRERPVANTECLLYAEHSVSMVLLNLHHNPVALLSFQV